MDYVGFIVIDFTVTLLYPTKIAYTTFSAALQQKRGGRRNGTKTFIDDRSIDFISNRCGVVTEGH